MQQRVNQTVSKEDSILHKSILCDKRKGTLPAFFRIITQRDVTDALKYLKTQIDIRSEKLDLRPKLLKSLRSSVERNRPKKLAPFTSPNGNDVEYWLDHAEWEVIQSQELLDLRCTKLIRQAAHRKRIFLSENGDPERILCSLLDSLFRKGQKSRILNSMADKSYHRNDFLPWFENEIEHYTNLTNQHVKVYSTNQTELQAVLSSFFKNDSIYHASNDEGVKECIGLQGEYHRRQYGYDLIAHNLYGWFHEVLLLPNEIADHTATRITDNFKLLTRRYRQEASFLNKLIAKALLHSTIRTTYKSQPIPASLHVDDEKNTCFDNIHIILNTHKSDTLLMGFSHLINEASDQSLEAILQEFHALLASKAFSSQKEKVLIAKKDNYLLDHDINDILDANSSLDRNLDRFKFAFFIGYESQHLHCNSKSMDQDFEKQLVSEATNRFKHLVDQLITVDDFYKELHIEAYLYPVPSLASLLNEVQNQVAAQWKTP